VPHRVHLIAGSFGALLALCVFSIASSQESQAQKAVHDASSSKAAIEHTTVTEHAAEHGSAAHGAHHDDTDLSHGNATANLASPADLRFDMSIYSFIVFLLLLGVLYKFAWGPIATALQRREETIARQIEEAKLASEKGASLLKEYEARLAAATDEARQIVAGARKDAELAKDRIVAEAREGAQKERDRAVADINVAKNQALDEIAQRSVQTAVSLASQIIRREVRPQEHEALIGEAMGKFAKMN
jgi:F-type H+-transporting ATPase subunit b